MPSSTGSARSPDWSVRWAPRSPALPTHPWYDWPGQFHQSGRTDHGPGRTDHGPGWVPGWGVVTDLQHSAAAAGKWFPTQPGCARGAFRNLRRDTRSVIYKIPGGWTGEPSRTTKGIIFLPHGSAGAANTTRIMEPTALAMSSLTSNFYPTLAQVLPVLLLALIWDSAYLMRLRRQRRPLRRMTRPASGSGPSPGCASTSWG